MANSFIFLQMLCWLPYFLYHSFKLRYMPKFIYDCAEKIIFTGVSFPSINNLKPCQANILSTSHKMYIESVRHACYKPTNNRFLHSSGPFYVFQIALLCRTTFSCLFPLLFCSG